MLDVTTKDERIGRTIENNGSVSDHARRTNGAEHGGGFPMTVRCGIVATLPDRRASIQTRHVGFGTGFIEENKLVEVGEAARDGEVHASANDVRTILFVGSKRFF